MTVSIKKSWLTNLSKRFVYRGNAMAFGGTNFEAQASCSLPMVGGMAEDKVPRFNLEHLGMSITDASVRSVGNFDVPTQSYVTVVTSRIGRFQVNNVLEASDLSVTAISRHEKESVDQAHITLCTTDPLVFRLKGAEVTVDFCDDLLEIQTQEALKKEWRRKTFRKAHGHRFFHAGRTPLTIERSKALPMDKGIAFYSVVQSISMDGSTEGLSVEGNIIHVAGFGSIHLGEVYRDEHTVRFILMRIELAQPVFRRPSPELSVAEQEPQSLSVIQTEVNGTGTGPN